MQVAKIKSSELQGWIAGYDFKSASLNHHVQAIKAIFAIAVADKVIIDSPASGLKHKKVTNPGRITPSFDEFNAIIADVREQRYNAEATASADYLEFMGLVGVGQAEASSIQRQHVNLSKKQLAPFRLKTKTPHVIPIKKSRQAACKRLGCPAYTQRSLRRMFITRCIEKGIDVKVT